MTDRFVRFPLSRRLTMRAGAPRSSRRVRMLTGASDVRRDVLDRVGAAAVAALGTRLWRDVPAWPWPAIGPDDLADALGDPLAGLVITAAAAPRQDRRHRLSLLCRWDGADVIVKLGDPGDGLENEAAALCLLDRHPLPGIATPRVLASGTLVGGTLAYLATDALGLRGQRPAVHEPLRTFEADLAERLGTLARPPDAADDAVPVHGDLAPWNLRRTSHGLALFDWESAGWGAPGSDVAHYRQACAAIEPHTSDGGRSNGES